MKGLDLVEATIRSAAQDSSSETRSIGRSMYAAYVRAMPDKGQAFLRRMDTGLQEKLSQATLTYIPGWAFVSWLALHLRAMSLPSCARCQVHATCCCLFLVLHSGVLSWCLLLLCTSGARALACLNSCVAAATIIASCCRPLSRADHA